ncbi:MAG: virulence factor [Caldilineaceae bacterium]|nr:virulence factor [Caldilineaceae bacterium]
MATFQILYWHDIPLQVKASERGKRHSASLSERFQEAVDAAAMLADLTGSDAYTDQFRWGDPQERDGSPAEVAAAVAAELEVQFAAIDWRGTANRLKRGRG